MSPAFVSNFFATLLAVSNMCNLKVPLLTVIVSSFLFYCPGDVCVLMLHVTVSDRNLRSFVKLTFVNVLACFLVFFQFLSAMFVSLTYKNIMCAFLV